MNLDQAAELCRRFEGFRTRPYLCPAGVPTIGYGTTMYPSGRKVRLTDPPATRETAEYYLRHELERVCAPGVARLCPVLSRIGVETGDWSKFNAIVDFAFNLGVGRLQTSTLRKRIAEEDWDGARRELMRWVRGGGRILPGLVKRRAAEAQLI